MMRRCLFFGMTVALLASGWIQPSAGCPMSANVAERSAAGCCCPPEAPISGPCATSCVEPATSDAISLLPASSQSTPTKTHQLTAARCAAEATPTPALSSSPKLLSIPRDAQSTKRYLRFCTLRL